MQKRIAVLVLILLSSVVFASCSAVSRGKSNYAHKKYAEALKDFELAANQGNAEAQHYLGIMYYSGKGMPINFDIAEQWFEIAYSNGYNDSLFWIAKACWYSKYQIPAGEWSKKRDRALKIYFDNESILAETGDSESWYIYGMLMDLLFRWWDDDDFPFNPFRDSKKLTRETTGKMGVQWIKKSANAGWLEATDWLIEYYTYGENDENERKHWLDLGKEQGSPKGLYNLGQEAETTGNKKLAIEYYEKALKSYGGWKYGNWCRQQEIRFRILCSLIQVYDDEENYSEERRCLEEFDFENVNWWWIVLRPYKLLLKTSMLRLGEMYDAGLGGPIDSEKAAKLFQIAEKIEID